MSSIATPERLRLLAVDVEIELRRARGEGGEDAGQRRVLVGRDQHAPDHGRDVGRRLSLERLQRVLEPARRAEADDRREVERHGDAVREGRELRSRPFDDGLHAEIRGGALLVVLEAADDEGAVGGDGAADEVEADDRDHVLDGRILAHDGLDLGRHLRRAVERGALGDLQDDEHPALVLARQEALRGDPEDAVGAGRRGGDEDERDDADPDEPAHDPGIAAGHLVDAGQHPADRAPRPGTVLQQHRAERRRERERVDRRDQHGGGDGDGELAEQLARDAGQEGDRHEDRKQHHGDGEDRAR